MGWASRLNPTKPTAGEHVQKELGMRKSGARKKREDFQRGVYLIRDQKAAEKALIEALRAGGVTRRKR